MDSWVQSWIRRNLEPAEGEKGRTAQFKDALTLNGPVVNGLAKRSVCILRRIVTEDASHLELILRSLSETLVHDSLTLPSASG